jgi:tetratricopeptide (TPR) repeat protein
MSHQISRWTGIISIGITISLVQTHIVAAKSSVEIAKTARAITVLISEPNSIGSGVIFQRQGDIYTVLTAAHVVKNGANYRITTPDDRAYEVISSSIRSAPGGIDLAVVKFKSTTNYPTAKLGNCNVLEMGMDLYVGGFPGSSRAITEPIFVFREGKVSANSNKVLENGYSLVYSNSTLPGMSGGAVLNSDGELVAIHGRGDRDENNVKTGFNLGIPVNRFATVAAKMGVSLSEKIASIPQNTTPKADDFIALAIQKYNKQDYQGSLTNFDRAIQLNPNSADAYTNRGILKADRLQDFQGALADLNRAIQLDPNHFNAYAGRGILKADRFQDLPGGLADLDRAVRLDPTHFNAYANRGIIKVKLQDFQGALTDYNRAIQIDPNYVNAYANRGHLKAKLQDVRGAVDDYNRAIQLNPSHFNAYNGRGSLKADKVQDMQGALADYDRAIQLNPNSALAYGLRGLLKYQSMNDLSGGIADLQQSARLFQQQGNRKSYQKAIDLLKKWQQ